MAAAPLKPNEGNPAFDGLAEAASVLMDAPVGLVFLGSGPPAQLVGQAGALSEAALAVARTGHRAVLDAPGAVVVPGASGFCAGAPLVVDDRPVGSLCAVDRAFRSPSERQMRGLAALARQGAALVEAREAARRAERAAAKARTDEAMLRAATDAGFDTFFVLSPLFGEDGAIVDFRFEFLNAQAGHFFGEESARLVGLPLVATFPTGNCRGYFPRFVEVLRTGETFEAEYISQMPAMRGRWARMKVARTDGFLVVTGQDVHDRREARDALQSAQARLAATFDAVQVGIMVVSPEGLVLRANPEAERALGLESGATQFVGSRLGFETLNLDGSPVTPDERPVAGALQGIDVRGKLLRLRWPNGREMCIHANAVPLRREGEATPYAAVCSFLDVTVEQEQRRLLDARIAETAETNILLEAQRYQLQRANERLEALATTDGLTGLLNHRAFQELLEGATRQAARTGTPLSLLLLDVDRFKAFNDDFGHPAGDAVLKGVASLLARTCRAGEVAARYGGEEFVVVLPNAGPEEAFRAAERLRRAIEAEPWPDRAVTASFGAATLSADPDRPRPTRADLIRAADEALYASKRAGRNRTTHADALSTKIPLPSGGEGQG